MAELTIQDIANAVSVIDVAAARGAIRADEMENVGALRNRLATFVAETQKQNLPEEQESDTVTEETE